MQRYQNEYYSVEYPADWEEIRVGWESHDFPISKAVELKDAIKNPLVLTTFRPKENRDAGWSVSIFVVASTPSAVLDEIEQYEKTRGGIRPPQELPVVSYDSETPVSTSFVHQDSGTEVSYDIIGKKDGQNEIVNTSIVIVNVFPLNDPTHNSRKVWGEIARSFKFSDSYKKLAGALPVRELESNFKVFLLQLEKNLNNPDFMRRMESKKNLTDTVREAERQARAMPHIFLNRSSGEFPNKLKCDDADQTCLAQFDLGNGDAVWYKFQRDADGIWYDIDYKDDERF